MCEQFGEERICVNGWFVFIQFCVPVCATLHRLFSDLLEQLDRSEKSMRKLTTLGPPNEDAQKISMCFDQTNMQHIACV